MHKYKRCLDMNSAGVVGIDPGRLDGTGGGPLSGDAGVHEGC